MNEFHRNSSSHTEEPQKNVLSREAGKTVITTDGPYVGMVIAKTTTQKFRMKKLYFKKKYLIIDFENFWITFFN